MAHNHNTIQVFSEYEIKNSSVQFGEGGFLDLGCVGSIEETLDTIVISKRCEGVTVKTRTLGAGTGELTLALHINNDVYVKAFDMERDDLADGVVAYGRNNRHQEFCFVAEVRDEDGKVKYIAYPRCIIKEAPSKIENGAEEVAEREVTLAIMADEQGNCKYEAIAEGLAEEIKTAWLTAFNYELVKKA